ncbi:plastid ribosomal protein S16 [Dunaliella salina]|uniref:30S ribosomal protein S16, chloroplastic n=1 Tax=Dunaliella salina TaxID=3046 RepID=A0ABQ7GVB5_DUNSA|nr:plastid ribosomal protein S16 [Dunaliella salina]|eukprot:KAF5838519.1 plastid ribosomal protein S16 [Dunaliella salina]
MQASSFVGTTVQRRAQTLPNVRSSNCVATARPVSRLTVPVIENRVSIRFQRIGRKFSPFYRLVAMESRDRRDGRPKEYLGWYDPLKKETNLNAPAIKQWLAQGAQPSDTVKALLQKAYVIEPDVKVKIPKESIQI